MYLLVTDISVSYGFGQRLFAARTKPVSELITSDRYQKDMRCTVFGTGYLGATHAACMAELGHDVLGVDVNEGKVAKLTSGHVPFHEPGLDDVLQRGLASGRLRFTTSYEEAAAFADLHFIAVGTPQRKGEYAADTSHVEAVIDTLAPLLDNDATIIGKSTVPVGTAAALASRARELSTTTIEVAWNPEFLREGHAVRDTLQPDRLVVGIEPDGQAGTLLRELYAPLLADGVDAASSAPVSASAAAASPKTYAPSWPEPVNSARTKPSTFCVKSTASTCGAAPKWLT